MTDYLSKEMKELFFTPPPEVAAARCYNAILGVSKMERLFFTLPPSDAIAHCLNATIGIDKDPNTIGTVIRWNIDRKRWIVYDGKTPPYVDKYENLVVLAAFDLTKKIMDEAHAKKHTNFLMYYLIPLVYRAQSSRSVLHAVQLFKVLVAMRDGDMITIPTTGTVVELK